MKKVPATSLLLLLALSTDLSAQSAAPPNALPRSTPEAQGIPSSAILALVQALEDGAYGVHSLMVVRHGHVVAEGWWTPYAKSDPHVLYSLSKSFASTAVGLAIAEGKLTLDEPVLAAFPEDAPAGPSDNLKAMRVRDLLTMSTGQHAEAIEGFSYDSEERLPKLFLALPDAHKPGTHFVYNTPATYMLSAMVHGAAVPARDAVRSHRHAPLRGRRGDARPRVERGLRGDEAAAARGPRRD